MLKIKSINLLCQTCQTFLKLEIGFSGESDEDKALFYSQPTKKRNRERQLQ